MTGIIVALAPNARMGTIRTPEGGRVSFSASVVLGDFEALAVGHRVSFDLGRSGLGRDATRVMREPVRPAASPGSPAPPPDLRYAGFDQTRDIRSYRFDALVSGQPVQRFVVTVDLALLLQHNVGVQELPALCMRKLAADLNHSPQSQIHQLGAADLAACAAARATGHRRRPRFAGRRGAAPPSPSN